MATERLLRRTALAASLQLLVGCGSDPEAGFDYLEVRGHQVATGHGLPLSLRVPDSLTPLGESHFREEYGGPEFNVSTTAFASDSMLLALHAEEHTDGSGGLDYSSLTPDTLAGIPLHSRLDCFDLREETAEDIEGNGFLRFLKESGFDFDRAYTLHRSFMTNQAGTAEVVLSYGRLVPDCGPGGPIPPDGLRVQREAHAIFGSLRRP